jgi:hypothetical protein
MAGKKGRSGGHNRIPPYMHLQQNTFKPSRHGSRAAARAALAAARAGAAGAEVAGATALQPRDVPEPPADLVAGLGDRGLAFVLKTWNDYGEWSAVKLVLLHELGGVVDTLARYEVLVAGQAAGPVTAEGVAIARLRAQAQRTYTLLSDKLDLKD